MSATYPLTVIEEHGARPGLTGFVESVHEMISAIADEVDVPSTELTVVLTGDITASVRARSETEKNFTPERSGGIVTGKTISLVRDFSETAIVLDTGDAAADEDLDQAEFLHLTGTSTDTPSSADSERQPGLGRRRRTGPSLRRKLRPSGHTRRQTSSGATCSPTPSWAHARL